MIEAGWNKGVQKARERAVEGALSHYSLDPSQPMDEQAVGVLARYAPQQLAALEAIKRKRTEEAIAAQARTRAAELGSLAATDPNAAATGALQAGDVDLAKQFYALGDDQRKAVAERYKSAAPIAYQIAKLPYEQRKAAIQAQMPALQAGGWTPEQINAFDPTDEALGGLVSSALTVQQLIERDTPKTIAVEQGGSLFERTGSGPIREVLRANPGGIDFGTPVSDAPAANEVGAVLGASLPAPVVAGFLGNFHAEGGYGGAKGDGGTAHGIAQWRGERQTNFQRVIGKPVSQATTAEQAKFVLWEMENPEAAGMSVAQRDAILAAKTPGEAAGLIDQYYERSSGAHRQKRVAAAERMTGGGGGKTDDKSTLRRQAQEAIAAGADPVKVRQRAAEMGVSL
jgi:hypothetical protein